MGPDTQNKETGVWKIKHKLMKLKQKVEVWHGNDPRTKR
jgi:hypothetical protein